jgi:hypothetical protein
MRIRTFSTALAAITLLACSASHEMRGDGGADAGPQCAAGQDYFLPGCDTTSGPVLPGAGCYARCEDHTTCPRGMVCEIVSVHPCPGWGPGGDTCAACGAPVALCVPAAPCEGRSYCDCTDGCAPLVDVTAGCVCPCDDPFNCTGELCDCACGGAEYLGCAPAGRCAETELRCPSRDCRAVLSDGCPTCLCSGG